MADKHTFVPTEEDKAFLLHFIIGTYFRPDLKTTKDDHPKSAFQRQAENLPSYTSQDLTASYLKRHHLETIYRYLLRKADPSLMATSRFFREYFRGQRKKDVPLFKDLFPPTLHPQSRIGNQYIVIKSIAFINDPDVSYLKRDEIERFKRLTCLDSFRVDINLETDNEVDEGTESNGREMGLGLIDIGECEDAYLFRVSLPGVKRDESEFSCEIEDMGKVLLRGVTTTGQTRVFRFSQVFEMQTRHLAPPGHFSISFLLPGPVDPHHFSGTFGTDGILEGIVMKKRGSDL